MDGFSGTYGKDGRVRSMNSEMDGKTRSNQHRKSAGLIPRDLWDSDKMPEVP